MVGSTRTLLVLIFWGSHPGQSLLPRLGAVVSVHPLPSVNAERNEHPTPTEIETAGVCTQRAAPGWGWDAWVGIPGWLRAGGSALGQWGPSRTVPRSPRAGSVPRSPGTALLCAGPGGPGLPPPRGRGWAGGGAVSRPPRGGRARPLPPWSQVQTAGPAAAGRGRTGLPGTAAGAAPAGLHGECAGTPPCPRDPLPLLRDTPLAPAPPSSPPGHPSLLTPRDQSPPRCRDGPGWDCGPVGR